MSDDKIISLANRQRDGTLQSPKQALEEALNDTGKSGALKDGKKLLIIALDDSNGQYNINWIQAGMNMSECVALCEVSKALFVKNMDY